MNKIDEAVVDSTRRIKVDMASKKLGSGQSSDIDDVFMKAQGEMEPLLKENPRRFVMLPIQYPDFWMMYKSVSD